MKILLAGLLLFGCGQKSEFKDVNYSSATTAQRDTVRGTISIRNSNTVIENKVIIGTDKNTLEHGIKLVAKKPFSNITIRNCEIYNFGGSGIFLDYSINGLTIENCIVRNNRIAGIFITSKWDGTKIQRLNSNVTIRNCWAYDNSGLSSYTSNWSGSGMVIMGTVTGLITGCEAWNNGANNGSTTNGPVGIWCDDSKGVVIENSISHHNKGGAAKKDGGGFDIDGGSENCIIRNCKSYNNEGPGFAFFQWATANKWLNNSIVNCESTNDASNTGYGSFSVWGYSSAYKVVNGKFDGNKITKGNKGTAIKFMNGNHSGIEFTHNEIYVSGGATVGTIPASVVNVGNVIYQ